MKQALYADECDAGAGCEAGKTMNEVPGKLVRTIAAVRDQKQAEG